MNHRNTVHHDDILGQIKTGTTGATQWEVANIGNTSFPLEFLRNNSNDFYCFQAQSPHWCKQGAALDSIHIHYLLESAYTGNETLVFDIYWAWVMPGTVFPSDIANWNKSLGVSIIPSTGNLAAFYTDIVSLATNVAAPSPDGYGAGLVVRVVRGNGSYTGRCGIWWADAHAAKDRYGSLNEYTD